MKKFRKENRRWTEEDINYLKSNYGSLLIEEIAKHTNRSIDSVRYKASNIGLTEKKNLWSKADILFLSENVNTMPLDVLAKKLNRTVKSVATQRFKLKLSKKLPKMENSPIEKNIPYINSIAGEHYNYMANMDVGDSYAYPFTERQTVINVTSYFPDKIFRTKKIDDTTRRIWRIM